MTSRKEIQEAIDKIDMKAGEEMTEALQELITKGMELGVSPKEAFNLSDEAMETVYSQAYNLYNRGKYTESGYIFRLLIMLDFTQAKYQMGLAACLHMEKRYQQAIQLYVMTAMLNPGNPLPYYHAADCFVQQESAAGATMMLEIAMDEAKDRPEYAVLVERCKMMKESLKEQYDKEMAEEPEGFEEALEELKKAQEEAERVTKAATSKKKK